MKIFVR